MDQQKETIEDLLLKYLEAKPANGALLEDINKWWIQLDRTWHTINELDLILDKLIDKGLIRKHISHDNRVYYKKIQRLKINEE